MFTTYGIIADTLALMNLLNNPPLPPNNLPPKKNKMLWLGGFFILLLIVGSLAIRHVILSRTLFPGNGNMLTPRDVSFLQTVRNFIFKSDDLFEGQKDDRINVLLLGIGGPGHDGPYLSDTNIILSIKPSTKEVAMISIPRDLGVKIANYGWRKINNANAFGETGSVGNGGEYARKVFEETFKTSIPYYIRIDFTAFKELIDEVGGVAVDVPRAFTDQQFPGPNFSYKTIHFSTGAQTMNGETALEYSRSRHGDSGEGSDFARARRQQLILMALKEKLLSLSTYTNPITLQQIMNSLSNHVVSNMNLAQILYLVDFAKTHGEIKHLVLDDSPSGYLVSTIGESGAFLLSPKTGNFDSINSAIAEIFNNSSTPSLATPTPAKATVAIIPNPTNTTTNKVVYSETKIEIQNGTWRAGLAAKIKKRLEEKGFVIITIGNSLKRPIEKTSIYLVKNAIPTVTIRGITQELKTSATTFVPDWLSESYDNPATTEDEKGMKYNQEADILIILGDDLKY